MQHTVTRNKQQSHNYIEILTGMRLKIRLILALDELYERGISPKEALARSIKINNLYKDIHELATREPLIALALGYDAKRCGWVPGTDFSCKWLSPFMASFA